jgi:hypothetical protein
LIRFNALASIPAATNEEKAEEKSKVRKMVKIET